MSEQFFFPGMQPPPRRQRGVRGKDRLLFALPLEDAADAHAVHLRQHLCKKHGLDGHQILQKHLHVTLNHLDDFVGVPNEIVALSFEAASKVVMQPFDVEFDSVMSFSGRRDGLPFVLCQEEASIELKSLRASLVAAMRKVGLGDFVTSSFKPHVTLLYDELSVPLQPVQPVRWTVREFVLIHSLLGMREHVILGRWPLQT